MRLGFKIVWVEETRAALDKMSDAMAGQELADALMAGALLIEGYWKKIAPFKTGEYKRRIGSEVIHQSRDRAEVAIGVDIVDPPYPFFLEYGTSKMAPHPSARPAFDMKKGEAARETVSVLWHRLGLIWR